MQQRKPSICIHPLTHEALKSIRHESDEERKMPKFLRHYCVMSEVWKINLQIIETNNAVDDKDVGSDNERIVYKIKA